MARFSASDVIAGLVKRGVPQHVAEGVAMNFQDESGFDTGIQEQAPTSGRGGFGLAQWTGPRRVALEQFAQAQDKPTDDLDLQLDNFMRENAGEEAAAWAQVMASKTRQEAAVNFVNKWERPAPEHAASRSAKYMGAGDSPSEGGARFGGAGLGDPAYPVGKSPYELEKAATAGATPPAAKDNPLLKAGQAGLKAVTDRAAPVMGVGGNAPELLGAPPPMAAPSAPIVAEGYGRDQLAMLMQRAQMLGSGRIWG
jgi:hypothetical protein